MHGTGIYGSWHIPTIHHPVRVELELRLSLIIVPVHTILYAGVRIHPIDELRRALTIYNSGAFFYQKKALHSASEGENTCKIYVMHSELEPTHSSRSSTTGKISISSGSQPRAPVKRRASAPFDEKSGYLTHENRI